MDFLNYLESTGAVGGTSAGQGPDLSMDNADFFRKMGNSSRPKGVTWDDFSTPKLKSRLDPRKMYAMPLPRKTESFEEWLLSENTVSQSIKTIPEVIYKRIQMSINVEFANYAVANITADRLDWLKKWITFNIWTSIKSKFPNLTKDNISSFSSVDREINYWTKVLIRNIRQYSDYLTNLINSRPDIARSKFNNSLYTIEDIEKESDQWHEELKLKKRKSADPGRRVEIAGMPTGYYWVCLDKYYCDKEAKAMGHCGNEGGRRDDVIYSMRDVSGIPHLTFIVNKQKLGESKGFGNDKPETKYHPQIVAFLLGDDHGKPIVEFIDGGGYLPENNFQFSDLDLTQQKQVLDVKPYINSWKDYIIRKSGGNADDLKKYIEEDYGQPIVGVIGDAAILQGFSNIIDMIKWLEKHTNSHLNEIPDLENPESFEGMGVSSREAVSIFDDNANDTNKKIMSKIIAKLKKKYLKEYSKDEKPDFDVEWAVEYFEELSTVLEWAAQDGLRAGAEKKAYDSLFENFNNKEDDSGYGFFTFKSDYSWNIRIKIDDLGKLIESMKNADDYTSVNDLMMFSYSQPHSGFSGFDKENYNEYLGDQLNDVIKQIK